MYVRVIFAIIIGMAFVVVGLLIPGNLTMLFILLVIVLAFWLLPYIVRFELIGPELRTSRRSLDSKEWGKALEGEHFSGERIDAVSYTHLTLPTILLV